MLVRNIIHAAIFPGSKASNPLLRSPTFLRRMSFFPPFLISLAIAVFFGLLLFDQPQSTVIFLNFGESSSRFVSAVHAHYAHCTFFVPPFSPTLLYRLPFAVIYDPVFAWDLLTLENVRIGFGPESFFGLLRLSPFAFLKIFSPPDFPRILLSVLTPGMSFATFLHGWIFVGHTSVFHSQYPTHGFWASNPHSRTTRTISLRENGRPPPK